MKVTIDEITEDMIHKILVDCYSCKDKGDCAKPYTTIKDVIRSALMKFSGMDCTKWTEEP